MAPIRAALFAGLIGFAVISPATIHAAGLGPPPNAREGACFIRHQAPALIETVTQQVLVQPEKRGVDPETGQPIVISPAIYSTETVQKIVRPRHEAWVEIVCVKDLTTIFVETLQRAMAARKQYYGVISGVMDERTKRAVRRVQKGQGINSTDVTIDLAESYGLITHRIFNQ